MLRYFQVRNRKDFFFPSHLAMCGNTSERLRNVRAENQELGDVCLAKTRQSPVGTILASTLGMSTPSSSNDTSKLLAEADAIIATDSRKAESLYKKVFQAPKCSCTTLSIQRRACHSLTFDRCGSGGGCIEGPGSCSRQTRSPIS